MDANRHRLLATYLNDHLAGATAGVGRARSARDSNAGTEFAAPLAAICAEIEDDLDTLVSIMDELGIGRSKLKPILGQVGERLGRLKPNGQLRGHSPLGRVIDLEVLIIGITGKLRLWTLLDDLLDGETAAELPALILRAEDQRAGRRPAGARGAAALGVGKGRASDAGRRPRVRAGAVEFVREIPGTSPGEGEGFHEVHDLGTVGNAPRVFTVP